MNDEKSINLIHYLQLFIFLIFGKIISWNLAQS